MAMPSVLKNMNLFIEGESYIGQVEEVVLPKLTRKQEKLRTGGTLGAVGVDLGFDDDALAMEITMAGNVLELVKLHGTRAVDGIGLRFAGAYQRDDLGSIDAVEIAVRGRSTEIDRGTKKVGDKTQTKVPFVCTYYKETVNGEVIREIDVLNLIDIASGNDQLKDIRRALGV